MFKDNQLMNINGYISTAQFRYLEIDDGLDYLSGYFTL